MIIWGSKGKATEASRGIFYCPRCQSQQQYIHKEVGKFFTLYFIPLFRTSMVGEYIECRTCRTPFEMLVLNYDHETEKKKITSLGKRKQLAIEKRTQQAQTIMWIIIAAAFLLILAFYLATQV